MKHLYIKCENRNTVAIAIQEIDAWILTKYDKGQEDTGLFLNPKERLNKTLNKMCR